MFFLMVAGEEIFLTTYILFLKLTKLFFDAVSKILLLLVDIIEGIK